MAIVGPLAPLSLSGQNVEFRQSSLPAGVVNQVTFPALGSQVETLTAPPASSGYRFAFWTLNGTRINNPSGQGANPVVFTINSPSEAIANYVIESLDSDNDALPDWWEIYQFGNLAQTAGADSDGDGLTNKLEFDFGTHPSLYDERMAGGISRRRGLTLNVDVGVGDTTANYGGISRRRSTPFAAILNTNYARLTELSSPAGAVDQERILLKGSTVALATAPDPFNAYRFTGWLVDGTRLDTATQKQPIPLTVAKDTQAIARYIDGTVDSDADGIPDWMELYFFDSLAPTFTSDTDADGIPWSVEQFRGYSVATKDGLEQGGLSRRRSVLIEVDTLGRIPYHITSDPAGGIEISGRVASGSVVTTPDLKDATVGDYRFSFWEIAGVRQADSAGNPISSVSFAVTAPTTITAHYFRQTVDDDFDGLLDWREMAYFGTLSRNGSDDADNDGISLAGELFRGYSPRSRDSLQSGGLSRRRSLLTALNTIQLSVPPIITVNGPTDVTTTGARLNALVNPAGLATTVYFEHGPTSAYGSKTATQSIGSGSVSVTIAAPISGLVPATVYHFRVVAENSRGVTTSADYAVSTLWDAAVTEGFEGPAVASRWQTTAGVWQVGAPTSGPAAPFAGAASVGTSMAGNYSAGADSQFVSPLFEVPSLGQFPHLRFDHWWDFGAGDYGAVEIREGTTGIWQTAATFTGRFNEWSEKSLDLSAYAGRKIQIAFRIKADADASVGPGWFIDDVRLVTGEIDEWLPNSPDPFAVSQFWRNWTVTGTVWESGIPTSGPGAAFEGTTCAATILAGNTPANADSRLVSPFFLVPDADQHPRFRFWHWFQLGTGDYATVEVRELGGAWQETASYTGVGGASWSKPAVHLEDFAGKWVQVAFRLTTNASDNRAGWYIDSAQIVTGAEVLNNPETFDGDVGDWFGDIGGLWQIGHPTSGPNAAHSGNNVAATNLAGNYPASLVARLESPAFQIGDPGLGKLITLSFWQWHQFGTGDGGELQIAIADGTSWSQWITLLNVQGSNGGWQQEAVDLSAHKGKTVKLGFLQNADGDNSTGAGWYLDDIAITSVLLGEFSPDVPVRSSVSASGERQYYVLNVPQAGPLTLNLDLSGTGASTAIYVRKATAPTFGEYDYRAATVGSADQRLLIPFATPGTYYVLVHVPTVTTASDFVLTATSNQLVVESVSPALFDTRQNATLTVQGGGFEAGVRVELLNGGSVATPATTVEINSLSSLGAAFPAGSVNAGRYSVKVTVPGRTPVVVPDAVEFKSSGEGKLVASLVVPSRVGRATPATIYVTYRNDGDAPIDTPLLSLTASGQSLLTLDQKALATGLWTTANPRGFSSDNQFFADTKSVLAPGDSVTIPVYFAGQRDPTATEIQFQLGASIVGDTRSVDWAGFKDQLRPATVPADAWNIIWQNFTNMAGNTWGSYGDMLNESHRLIRGLRILPPATSATDVGTLLSHRLLVANGLAPVRTLAGAVDAAMPASGLPLVFGRSFPHSIAERFTLGPLGRGWSHDWDVHAEVQPDGAVEIVGPGMARRRFEPDTRRPGQFLAVDRGDHGTLRLVGANYSLQEKNGVLSVFRSDLRLGYFQDLNGNRITALYTGVNLTSLTHSNGSSLVITYNAADRMESITDSIGRATTFAYDSSGEHLVKVTNFDGRTTQYAYEVSTGSPSLHVIKTITNPDGTVRNLGYNSHGWLASTSRTGGAETVNFGYDGKGTVTSTDVLGHTTTVYFDERGQLAKAINPLGNSVQMAFDENGNLAKVVDPAGRAHSYDYDATGNLSRSVDPLGGVTRFGYGAFSRLSSLTDANGNLTRYTNDATGNLNAITYANNSIEQWQHDAVGNPTIWTNRRAQAVQYESDSAGRITAKRYPDGTRCDYVYDARGNLTSATNATGAITLAYDTKDQLTRITYPGNRWLDYTYDNAGRRASMSDQLGYRIDYGYDVAGRLRQLNDSTGIRLALYEYDAAGHLERKTLGNGVYTTYAYNAAGQLTSLVNHKPDGSVLSHFDYTYDSRGRRVEMTTHYGTWTYGYDDLGQLTRALLVSTDPAIPDQDLSYEYDPLGNRLRTVSNGVTTNYTTNNLNQYTTVGAATLTYDADGSLTGKSGGSEPPLTVASNVENRVTSYISSGGQRAFEYDALGFPSVVVRDGARQHQVHDPAGLGDLVGIYDEAGSLVERQPHGFGALGTTGGATKKFLTFDGVGNGSDSIDVAGTVLRSPVLAPFGERIHPSGGSQEQIGFNGEFGAVQEGELASMRARFFSPTLGRFTSADPLGLSSGDQNIYRFGRNDPLSNIDPSGLLRFKGPFIFQTYGKWGGPGMVNGQLGVWTENDDFPRSGDEGFDVPTNLRDWAYYHHDVNLNEASHIRNWFKRWKARRIADMVLAEELRNLNGAFGATWHEEILFGGALLGGLTPSSLIPQGYVPKPNLGTSVLGAGTSSIIASRDPNECIGPAGYGSANFILPDQVLPYRINFENDATAAAPAQTVVITNNLSANLDRSSFRVTEIGFGDQIIPVPANSQVFEVQRACTVNGHDIVVDISAGIDVATGQAYCRFFTLDPVTGLPPAVDVGLLPPEDGTGRGMGWFSFTIKPKPSLATGTAIRNIAVIKFDANATIATNQVDPHDASKGTDPTKEALVTIDADSPTGTVTVLPSTTNTASFTVAWSGTDAGAGVASYDIYSRTDTDGWVLWKSSATETTANWQGQFGHTYGFFAVARDGVGHIQSPPIVGTAPQTQTNTMFTQPGTLNNLSARAFVGTGDKVIIPGIVISGSGKKRMLVRAIGPGLDQFNVSGTLADPQITLYRQNTDGSATPLFSNDNWGTAPNLAELQIAATQVFAFPIANGSKDAALLVSLDAGIYTIACSGVGNTTGVALVEVYDVDDVATRTSKLVNISARAEVGVGDNVLVPGIVVAGVDPEKLLIRGVGPGLGQFGVTGLLADPRITLYRSNGDGTSTAIDGNDNWGTNANLAALKAAAAQVFAFPIPDGSADAALLVTVPPGIYTVVCSGVNNTSGVALIEVYEAP